MSNKNDITGDTIATKASSEQYRNNYDAIFRLSKEQEDAMDDMAGILDANKKDKNESQ